MIIVVEETIIEVISKVYVEYNRFYGLSVMLSHGIPAIKIFTTFSCLPISLDAIALIII